jgi:hypothetical protein
VPIACTDKNQRCLVCRLDFNTERKAKNEQSQPIDVKPSAKNLFSGLAACPKCKITAHGMLLANPRKIHELEEFNGLTCFKIVHTEIGYQVWQRTGDTKKYKPKMKHPICDQLRSLHGLDPVKARTKRKYIDDDDDDNSSTDN